MGGAVFNLGGNLDIVNCTLTDNAAAGGLSGAGGAPGSGLGGAIFNLLGDVNIVHATLAFNRTAKGNANGGALYNLGYLGGFSSIGMASSVTITNSILSNSLSDNLGAVDVVNMQPAVLVNGSPNLGVATLDLTQPDIVVTLQNNGGSVTGTPLTVDPQLGPLANNGGPTMTMALTATSSAVDTGGFAAALGTDQRGLVRPSGPAPDLGAYELTLDDVIFRNGFE